IIRANTPEKPINFDFSDVEFPPTKQNKAKVRLITMLYMAVNEYTGLYAEKQTMSKLSDAITNAMLDTVKTEGGQLLKYNRTMATAVFTGKESSWHAARAAERMRRELRTFGLIFGLNPDLYLKAGIYSTEIELLPEDIISNEAELKLCQYAERLASLSRKEAQGATVLNTESLNGNRMRYEALRSIFIDGQEHPVHLYRITALD
ncbi:hypothetical protein IJT17_09335, partial [bacterium]|nr:hypothetical protein [bacterium]